MDSVGFVYHQKFKVTRKYSVSETGSVFASSGEGSGTPTPLGPLERANVSHWNFNIFVSRSCSGIKSLLGCNIV
jgi:hypothetical protein